MRPALFLFIALAFTVNSQGQSLDALEAEMAVLQYQVGEAATDDARKAASDQLREKLLEAFAVDGVFAHPFTTLYKVGRLESGDGAFRLFSWNRPLLNGSYVYSAFLLFPDGDGFTELKHNRGDAGIDPSKTYSEKDWYGALYYYIQPVKHKGDTYYTLLGWDGSPRNSNYKVMDALTIDKKGNVKFGKEIFAEADGKMLRKVFEYAKGANMMLEWLPERQSIVFNDLAPVSGAAEGNYAFYGPSGAFHAYRLEKGQWVLEEEIDMSRPKTDADKPQFNFPPRPDLNKKRDQTNPLIGK